MSSRTEETVLSKDGRTKLFCRTWHPAGKPVGLLVIMHGYLEHGGRYREVGEYLANEASFTTTAYDLRGHGRSTGQRGYCWTIQDYYVDLEAILDKCREKEPGLPLFILAHSFGGLSFLDYARDKQLDGIAGAVVINPFVGYAEALSGVKVLASRFLGSIFPRLSLPVEELPAVNLTNDVAKQKEHDEDPDNIHYLTLGWAHESMKAMKRVVETTPLSLSMPILYIQSPEDKVCNPKTVDEVGKCIVQKDKTIVERPGECHEVLNEIKRTESYKIIGDWLVQRIK